MNSNNPHCVNTTVFGRGAKRHCVFYEMPNKFVISKAVNQGGKIGDSIPPSEYSDSLVEHTMVFHDINSLKAVIATMNELLREMSLETYRFDGDTKVSLDSIDKEGDFT